VALFDWLRGSGRQAEAYIWNVYREGGDIGHYSPAVAHDG